MLFENVFVHFCTDDAKLHEETKKICGALLVSINKFNNKLIITNRWFRRSAGELSWCLRFWRRTIWKRGGILKERWNFLISNISDWKRLKLIDVEWNGLTLNDVDWKRLTLIDIDWHWLTIAWHWLTLIDNCRRCYCLVFTRVSMWLDPGTSAQKMTYLSLVIKKRHVSKVCF